MQEQPDYNYLDLLNPQQREAVVYKDGPALVIAGAGSGKTRVLTYKIVDLIRNGYEPYRILALTFTNKAAREMKERITSIVGERIASRLWMGTFHSIFLRILRRHAEEIGFKSGFTIYDTADSRSLIKMIVKDMGLDEKAYKPASIASAISNAKNAMVTPEQYILDRDNYESDRKAKRPLTGEIYRTYCERCKVSNAMDFDDILEYMNLLMRDFPDVRRHYQEFFRYILVDEYQDTNFAQHLIISQLTGTQNRLCVVGDDAQSIYSFRGADINNILTLERRYPGLKIFKLERNYRSTQNIIDAAGSLISKNTRQMKKNVFSENDKGEPIAVVKTYSDMEEAFMVANMISKSKFTNHDSYDEYAVLYRTNAQSRVLEESLRKRNIPYRIYGGLSFYQRKEVKDMIAYFRLSVNPDDDEALKRVINYPARGIGETTLKKLHSSASENGKSIWQVITSFDLKSVGLNAGTVGKIAGFRNLIQEFIDDNVSGSNAFELGQLIYNRTGILTLLAHDSTPESISRQENLSEIIAGLKDFVDIREQTGEGDVDMRAFLSEVMLATDQDEKDDDNLPKVTLMTVHAAKGLEFKHVYVVGVEEDLFPSSMSQDSLAQVEEERRLLYVAITRAKSTCTLTYAGSRFRNGQTVLTSPSRFLGDIDTRFLHLQLSSNISEETGSFVNPLKSYKNYNSVASAKPLYSNAGASAARSSGMKKLSSISSAPGIKPQHTASELSPGSIIVHDKLGRGTVVKIDSLSGEDTITVDFGVIGIKKLLLKFAKFSIVKK
ncbi:MAG: UvrD-helicase domain-containing protein [Muribaculaceae bacterium]